MERLNGAGVADLLTYHEAEILLHRPDASTGQGENQSMTYVITEPCVGVKDGSCADVCPVECIHTMPNDDMYFIDPDECIDCGVCVPECPVDAIYPEEEVPAKYERFTLLNAEYFEKNADQFR